MGEHQRKGAQYPSKLLYSRPFSTVKHLRGNGKMPLMRLGNTQIACCNRRIYLTALAWDRQGHVTRANQTVLNFTVLKAYGESNGE
jgi:hypothetical protein